MTASDGGGSGAHQGWRKGLVAWWRRLFSPVRGPGDPGWWRDADADGRGELVTINDEVDDWSFTTPALGEAHDFTVQTHCSWSVSRSAVSADRVNDVRRELRDALATARSGIGRRVEDEVRRLARQYPPYRASEAEREIGREIETCMNDGDVRCRIALRIGVADPVRTELQAFWSRRMELDLNLDYSQHKAERLREVQEAWAAVLASGLTDLDAVLGGRDATSPIDSMPTQPWTAPWALLLAEQPVGVAQVLDDMLQKRIGQGEELLAKLSTVVRQHQDVDAYDVAVRSDAALRRIMQGLGVPVPHILPSDTQEPSS